ncbi:LysR family transcriptional regulator [Roseomonas sp. WA12]
MHPSLFFHNGMEGRPIITLKQAEAFYWVATLGSVVEAAERLHLAQSTLSKRIIELEAAVPAALFDRGGRAVTLTSLGSRLLPLASDLLAAEARFREAAIGPRVFDGPVRFGVTEMIALTWLPRLIDRIREVYPLVVPEPEIDASGALFDKLADRRLDFVIGLNPPTDGNLRTVPLNSVTLHWAAAPGMGPKGDVVPLAEIANYPVLTQGDSSGLQKLLFDWFHTSGVRFSRVVKCNSLHVLTALTVAGLGVSFLSERHVRPEVETGRLRVFRTVPAIPAAQYFFVSRVDAPDAFTEHVIRLVQQCCDFDWDVT